MFCLTVMDCWLFDYLILSLIQDGIFSYCPSLLLELRKISYIHIYHFSLINCALSLI